MNKMILGNVSPFLPIGSHVIKVSRHMVGGKNVCRNIRKNNFIGNFKILLTFMPKEIFIFGTNLTHKV